MTDPFSMKELKDAFMKVKTRKAPGPDGITGEMLKHLGACSKAVLLKIFNHSWMKGVVPAVWKEVIVIQVQKKGKDKKNPRSYRPISLLCCVDKLLKRVVNWRHINHLESNNAFSLHQFSLFRVSCKPSSVYSGKDKTKVGACRNVLATTLLK